jgi:hypothetical protein
MVIVIDILKLLKLFFDFTFTRFISKNNIFSVCSDPTFTRIKTAYIHKNKNKG